MTFQAIVLIKSNKKRVNWLEGKKYLIKNVIFPMHYWGMLNIKQREKHVKIKVFSTSPHTDSSRFLMQASGCKTLFFLFTPSDGAATQSIFHAQK